MSAEESDPVEAAAEEGAVGDADDAAAEEGAVGDADHAAAEEGAVGDADHAPAEDDAAEERAFAEGNHETVMTVGHAGMPKYVLAAWVCLFIGYIAYFYRYGWPDLTAWGTP